MKIYTIIGGVNGTGKSSLTGVLRRERRGKVQLYGDSERAAV